MNINGVEIDRDKFIGRLKVRADGKIQAVTITSDGSETTAWFSWQQIKQIVEEILQERKGRLRDE